jgi:cytochrome c biogenesis protein CcdA
MIGFPILITLYAGFVHAFETDHLLAVSNIVTRRKHLALSLKDGIFWGLGHTSTILLIGMLMLVLKMNINENQFRYFEAGVGLMLIGLGIFRLWKYKNARNKTEEALTGEVLHNHHRLAYGVGLVHGLAGSGVLMVLVMAQMDNSLKGMAYLIIFGLGSVAGMAIAAGIFSVPFSKKILQWKNFQIGFLLLSCLLCVIYGTKVVYDNLSQIV